MKPGPPPVQASHSTIAYTCSYCDTRVHPPSHIVTISPPTDGYGDRRFFDIQRAICPGCHKTTLWLEPHAGVERLQLFPAPMHRKPAPPEVPPAIADDYNEAGEVLPVSAKASAALARRCLQHILRANGHQKKDLSKEIESFINAGGVPASLVQQIDAVRALGNIAAHPMPDSAGVILDIEDNEALWMLDLLDELFEHLYVAPARRSARVDALNAKQAAAGKPPIK